MSSSIALYEALTSAPDERTRARVIAEAFESLEDHPIDSEDGKLSISLWHGGNDYFVSTRDELDEYIAQQNELKIGGM